MPDTTITSPQSMTKRIRRMLTTIGVLSVLFTALGAAVLFHSAYAARTDETLCQIAQAISAGYEADPKLNTLSSYLHGTSLRITLIAPDGSVLYDSLETDVENMGNHLDRPEVQQAFETGTGHAVRDSATAGYETHYHALRLQDGTVLRLADDTRDIWNSYNQVLPLLLLGCLVIVLMGLVLSWGMTLHLMRPITHMADNLDKIETDVPYIELIPLAKTIHDDRKLREDNETMRREFTANVSHELKTPLTSISGYAEMIESGMAKPEDIQTFGHRIYKEAQRMIALVADILQLSELDGMHVVSTDKAPVERISVDLAALVKDVAAVMTVNARKAYITLQYDAQPAAVLGNSAMLTELVTNLCDNAIRYNRPGGHVNLRCGTTDGTPWFSVEDNGIGIPQDAQSRVFERFYRVDKSRSKETGGTGLGLAIVKHIAMLHGAHVELHSTVGTGTTITIIFPKP